MLRTDESETEILLGNKQLLGIFMVVAVLLGVSFTGGFLIGRGGMGKKGNSTVATASDTSAAPAMGGGQTHTLEGETTLPAAASGGADSEAASPVTRPLPDSPSETRKANGPRKHSATTQPVATESVATRAVASAKPPAAEPEARGSETVSSGYEPHAGAEYLQVAAVGRDEAEAVADVLHKKGFPAHAVPKPGNAKLYRVIIGPVKDAGELSSTRDALRKTGFREVIVQRY